MLKPRTVTIAADRGRDGDRSAVPRPQRDVDGERFTAASNASRSPCVAESRPAATCSPQARHHQARRRRSGTRRPSTSSGDFELPLLGYQACSRQQSRAPHATAPSAGRTWRVGHRDRGQRQRRPETFSPHPDARRRPVDDGVGQPPPCDSARPPACRSVGEGRESQRRSKTTKRGCSSPANCCTSLLIEESSPADRRLSIVYTHGAVPSEPRSSARL